MAMHTSHTNLTKFKIYGIETYGLKTLFYILSYVNKEVERNSYLTLMIKIQHMYWHPWASMLNLNCNPQEHQSNHSIQKVKLKSMLICIWSILTNLAQNEICSSIILSCARNSPT